MADSSAAISPVSPGRTLNLASSSRTAQQGLRSSTALSAQGERNEHAVCFKDERRI